MWARLGFDLSNHLAPDLRELELPSNLASKRKQIYYNEIQTRKPWAVPIHGKLLMTAFHEPYFSEGLMLGAVCRNPATRCSKLHRRDRQD